MIIELNEEEKERLYHLRENALGIGCAIESMIDNDKCQVILIIPNTNNEKSK